MRKIIFLPVLMLGIVLLSTSCVKERDDLRRKSITVPDEIMQIKISPDQSYQMDLTNDATVTISKQATHYTISETRLNVEKGTPSYVYQPLKGFIGADEVTLMSVTKISAGSNGYGGGCNNGDKTITKYTIVKITVGN